MTSAKTRPPWTVASLERLTPSLADRDGRGTRPASQWLNARHAPVNLGSTRDSLPAGARGVLGGDPVVLLPPARPGAGRGWVCGCWPDAWSDGAQCIWTAITAPLVRSHSALRGAAATRSPPCEVRCHPLHRPHG